MLVVREGGGYAGFNDRMIDLRVDDHPTPIEELGRLLSLYELYFLSPRPKTTFPLTTPAPASCRDLLTRSGDYPVPSPVTFDDATFEALEQYGGRENLEERLLHDKSDSRTRSGSADFMRQRLGIARLCGLPV